MSMPPHHLSSTSESNMNIVNGHHLNSSSSSLGSNNKKQHRPPPAGGFSYTSADHNVTEESNGDLLDVSTLSRDHDDEKQIKTKLYLKNEINFYTYSKCKFRLNMRKEVFSPSETIDNPILLDIIFWQIVNDVYLPNCIRLNDDECQQLQKLLKSEGIHSYNPNVYSAKPQFKRAVIERAREFSSYFCRLYSVTGIKNYSNVDYLGVSHSGVTLFHREQTNSMSKHDYFNPVQKFG